MPSKTFSSVVPKPGRKFAPKVVIRRNVQRSTSQTFPTPVARSQITPDRTAAANPQVDSTRRASPSVTRVQQSAQSQNSRNTTILPQSRGPGAQAKTSTPRNLTEPRRIITTAPSETEPNRRDEGRDSSRIATTIVNSTPTATGLSIITGTEKRTTRSTPVSLAGTKRKAADTVPIQETATSDLSDAPISDTTVAVQRSRLPPPKKHKATPQPRQSPASTWGPGTSNTAPNGDTVHVSAFVSGSARKSASAQAHDALLQNATNQAAAVSRLAEGIEGTQLARKDNRRRLIHKRAVGIVAAATNKPEPSQRPAKKKRAESSLQEVAAEIIGEAIGDDTASDLSRRKRRGTPEGAEEHQIEPTQVTLGDLTKDSGLGKKSLTERRMENINWEEVKQRRKDDTIELEKKREAEKEERRTGKRRKPDLPAPQHFPRTKIVGDIIVVDDDSRVYDRSGDAHRAAEDEAIKPRDDDAIYRRINQRTVGKQPGLLGKVKAQWDDEMTARFYKGLRMFGTDFMMVSALFPTLERRHIKLKYVREEREHLDRIHEALRNPLPVDLAEFEEETGKEMIDPRQVEKEIKADEERMRKVYEEERARDNEGAHPQDPAETVLQSREQGSVEPDVEEAQPIAPGKENRYVNVAEGIVREATGKAKGSGKKGPGPGQARKKGKDGSVAVSRKAAKAAKAAAVEGTGTVEAIGTVDEVPR